jgi:hypothetical protein
MKAAVEGMPPQDWNKPEGVIVSTVCGSSGLLAARDCPNPRQEVFIQGTEPKEFAQPQKPPEENGEQVPLVLSSPVNGTKVSSVIAVEGTTLPAATVTLVILQQVEGGQARVVDTTLPVTADGRFRYVYTPNMRVEGGHFVITVTASGPSGGRASTTITLED